MHTINAKLRRRKLVALALLATLASGACTSGSKQTKGPLRGGALQLISGLARFDACEDYLAWVKKHAADRVGPYGLSGGGFGIASAVDSNVKSEPARPLAGAAAETAKSSVSPQASGDGAANSIGGSGPTFSTTNNQEEGVDEPDLVKTDGKRMVVIQGNTLHVLDVSGAQPSELGRVLVGEDVGNGQLLVSGDRALVLAQGFRQAPVQPGGTENSGIASMPAPGSSLALLIEVDLSNAAKPVVVNRLELDGSYVNARLVGSTARVVIRSSPEAFDFVYPSRPNSLERARKLNQQIIAESTVEDWLPKYRLLASSGAVSDGRLVNCDQIHRPADYAGLSTMTVMTVDLGKSLTPANTVGMVADGDTVYASTRNLYVATNQVPEVRFDDDGNAKAPVWNDSTEYTTAFHRFDITGTGPARYTASGSVDGHLLNSYSLSEHEGAIRVATTKGTPWAVTATSQSEVTVLIPKGNELVEVGQIGNLGRGERIYAVRFIGSVGYVVTFRQTDPLYTLDLSDPTKPTVKGELKILGYSAYLHPVGDGLLLGIGQDATEQGRGIGAQLSLFDVSDIAKPSRLAQATLPQGWSDAEHDYHAFLWWQRTRTAVIPVQLWGDIGSPGPPISGPAIARPITPSTPFVGAIGFDIGTTTAPGVKERGRITHAGKQADCENPGRPEPQKLQIAPDGRNIEIAPGPDCFGYGPSGPPIQRSVIVNSQILTISAAGILTSDLGDFTERSWLAF